MRRFAWLVCLALIAVAGPARAEDRLNVVASFSILGDFVRNVGGERRQCHDAGRPRQRCACL